MLFNSLEYAVFLAAVVAVYWVLDVRYRKIVLVLASYVFYAYVDVRFLAILFGTTAIDYWVANIMGRATDRRRRLLLLWTSVGSNLVTLSFFKYFDWFAEPVRDLLSDLGFTTPDAALAVALPVGISFYTFSTLSYTIDVYRREIEPVRSPIDFMLFIAYFPHLLAGPIIRARRMLPQIANMPKVPDPVKLAEGLELILIGLFQKVAVADALSPATARIFAQFGDGRGEGPDAVSLWIAAFAAIIQFTFDFAGYSNMARGSSKLLGLELPYNFRQPLTRSRNFRDFWRRNHITMFAWFRDYLYRPLAGRHRGWAVNALMLCLVFAVSGLWHDDSPVWLTWGFLMGGVVAIELRLAKAAAKRQRAAEHRRKEAAARAVSESAAVADPPDPAVGPVAADPALDPLPTGRATLATPFAGSTAPAPSVSRLPSWWPVVAPAYVFVMVALQHVWVRTGSVEASLRLYRSMFTPSFRAVDWNLTLLFAYGLTALILLDRREHRIELREGKPDPATPWRLAGWLLMGVLIVAFSGQESVPFVYFRF